MTALIAVRHDQDWLGLVIVLGVLALALLAGWLETRDWWRGQKFDLQRIIDAGLNSTEPLDLVDHSPDHVDCANPDCDQTICACSKPAECTGCTTLGCPDEGLCWDCRSLCTDCALEDHTQRAMDWAAGR